MLVRIKRIDIDTELKVTTVDYLCSYDGDFLRSCEWDTRSEAMQLTEAEAIELVQRLNDNSLSYDYEYES